MSDIQILYLVVIFFIVFGFALMLMRVLSPTSVQQRMELFAGNAVTPDLDASNAWIARIAKVSGPFAKLSLPDEGWEASPLRIRFMNAGFRNVHAPAIYFGAKTLLAFLAPVLVWLSLSLSGRSPGATSMMFFLLSAAAAGLYLPNLVLNHLVATRQREIIEHFPDALDLMTICIEAGLAMDAAIARIAQEMAATAPALSEEMHLVTLELRAGSSKERALRNLGMRTGVEDVDTLVAMLIQAERFGTSIGASLRIHAEVLRTKRRQRAEEAAAKVALKLLFPLLFCIFPAIMLVLLGPAMIQIYRVLLPAMTGH